MLRRLAHFRDTRWEREQKRIEAQVERDRRAAEWAAVAARCGLQKARDHGRMQLIDGPRLVWMIREYLGRDVLIG